MDAINAGNLGRKTGRGFYAWVDGKPQKNAAGAVPEGLAARIRTRAWDVPRLFRLIQNGGNVSAEEMYRTFNMGIGMVVVVAPEDLHDVEHSLERRGEVSHVIGAVEAGSGVHLE